MRYVNGFAVRPGMQAEYRRRHDEIWPEMRQLIARAGLRNYSIWNTGTQLIEYFETEDLPLAQRILRESPVKARWDAYMSNLLLFDAAGNMTPLTLMFACN